MEDHCEDCVKGTVAEGTPTGTIAKFGGVDTYIARPSGDAKTTAAIIIATDVFGIPLVNNRLIADEFAKQTGFLCVAPDLFNGDAVPANALDVMLEDPPKDASVIKKIGRTLSMGATLVGLAPWFVRHGAVDKKMPIMDAVIKELKEKEGIKKIGVHGYCYGGKVAVKLAAADDKIDAYAVAHPSQVKVPGDVEAIKKPGLWLCAEEDRAFSESSRKQTEEILKKKDLAEFRVYPGTKHGFAVRGDDKNEQVKVAKQQALEEGIKFFQKYLAVDWSN